MLATRKRIPGHFIERIWVKRLLPTRRRNGKVALISRWVTFADRRAATTRVTGWFGTKKSGFSGVFKEAIRKLNRNRRSIAFEDAFSLWHRRVAIPLTL